MSCFFVQCCYLYNKVSKDNNDVKRCKIDGLGARVRYIHQNWLAWQSDRDDQNNLCSSSKYVSTATICVCQLLFDDSRGKKKSIPVRWPTARGREITDVLLLELSGRRHRMASMSVRSGFMRQIPLTAGFFYLHITTSTHV